MKNILIFLDSKMIRPTNYGWFHISSLLLLVLAIFLLCKLVRKPTNRSVKKVLLTVAITCILLEIYKQINFSFNYDDVKTWWSYQWYAFPFQFCSVPMYVALIAGLTKNKKLESYLYAFLATYGLIAGIAVMLYPNTVFTETIGIDIQTMIHHGLMVVMGLFLLVKKVIKPNINTFIKSLTVFVIIVLIAVGIDTLTYYLKIDGGLTMFFISPFHQSSLPIYSEIYQKVPYILFLLIYIGSFSLGSALVLVIYRLFYRKEKINYEKN